MCLIRCLSLSHTHTHWFFSFDRPFANWIHTTWWTWINGMCKIENVQWCDMFGDRKIFGRKFHHDNADNEFQSPICFFIVFQRWSNKKQRQKYRQNLLWKTLMRSVTAQQLENSHGLFFSVHFVWLCPGSGCCCCYYDNRVHFNKHSGVLSMFFWCWAGWWSKNRNDIIVDFSGVGVSTL